MLTHDELFSRDLLEEWEAALVRIVQMAQARSTGAAHLDAGRLEVIALTWREEAIKAIEDKRVMQRKVAEMMQRLGQCAY